MQPFIKQSTPNPIHSHRTPFIVLGSHTNVGKTLVSAALCFGFGFDYFKLIQAGFPQDREVIASLSPKTRIFPNGITLQTPASPHIGKQLEGVEYNGLQIAIPRSENLLIESAGGIYTPIDCVFCNIDFVSASGLPVILVGGYYLGGLNHILLSLKALSARKIVVLAVVISGQSEDKMDKFLSKYYELENLKLAHFPLCEIKGDSIHKQSFEKSAQVLKEELCALQVFRFT